MYITYTKHFAEILETLYLCLPKTLLKNILKTFMAPYIFTSI